MLLKIPGRFLPVVLFAIICTEALSEDAIPDSPPDDTTLPPVIVTEEKSEAATAAKRKAAAEKLKKRVNTAYKDPFYLNDFSYVNDPAYHGYNLGENLKQIGVGQGKVDFGGQYRVRYHHEQNIRGAGLTGKDDDFLLDRTRLFANYRINDRVRIYAETLNAGSSFEHYTPRAIEENRFDIQNLFADVTVLDTDAGKLSLRGGRQELLFGAQRVLAPLDWANTRRTFEGGRATWTTEESVTDVLLVHPMTVRADRFDSPNQDQTLYGVYNSRKESNLGPLDVYYLGFEDDRTFTRVHTLGTLLKGEAEDYVWDNEFGYQFGRNPDSSDISTFSLTVGGGRKLGGDSKPILWFYYDWAGGDDSLNNGWNQLFPLGHRYLGYMDLFGRRNIHDLNTMFLSNPTEKFTLCAWYHYLALSNGHQGPYNVTGTAFNPNGTIGSRDLGHEIDLMGTYKLHPRSDLVLGYSHFFSGRYYRTSLRANGSPVFDGDGDFIYTQWHVNF